VEGSTFELIHIRFAAGTHRPNSVLILFQAKAQGKMPKNRKNLGGKDDPASKISVLVGSAPRPGLSTAESLSL
jgi:hypothetical protein